MRTLNIVVYAVALVLAVAAYLKGENRHILGITEAIKTLLPVLPTLVGAYLIAGYVRVLLPESVIREWLGEESGLKGVLVGYLAGTLTSRLAAERLLQPFRVRRHRLRRWGLRHRGGVVRPQLSVMERRGQGEDDLAVLDRGDPPRGERPAVTHPVHDVDERHRRVTGADEVGVQRVHRPVGRHGPARGDQRLRRRPGRRRPAASRSRAAAAEDVQLDLLQVEQVQQLAQGVGHSLLASVLMRGIRLVSSGRRARRRRAQRQYRGTVPVQLAGPETGDAGKPCLGGRPCSAMD